MFAINRIIATFAITNSPSLNFAEKYLGLFFAQTKAIIARYKPLVSQIVPICFDATNRTLASFGKLTAFFVQTSNFVLMPKFFNEIRECANNSSSLTASSHETATVTINHLQVREILDTISCLDGEELVDCAYLATKCPSEQDLDCMLKTTLEFYSNVRYLCNEVKSALIPKEDNTK